MQLLLLAGGLIAAKFHAPANAPYKVVKTVQLKGAGGIDAAFADNNGERLYVPDENSTHVFDLNTHKYIATMTNLGGHGVAVDPQSHHGFVSSHPIGMFDTQTLHKVKTIAVSGRPDGILFEPLTRRIYVFSDQAPSITVIDPKDGTVVGTITVGGNMEQSQSDGQGRLYVVVEDEKKVAVVDVKAMKALTKYDLGEKAGKPAGLALDGKNHILFAMCHEPNVCVVLHAETGKILDVLPIGSGTDHAVFNPATQEAFSSQRDGTLTIIKENSPTHFEVTQNLATRLECQTCSLDAKDNEIVLICTESAAGQTASAPRRGNGQNAPGNLDVLFVGR